MGEWAGGRWATDCRPERVRFRLPLGAEGTWVPSTLWGFLQGLPGCGKGKVVVLFLSFIQKILVELLVPASDAMGRSSVPEKDTGRDSSQPPAP